jgi:hypothetical protein
MSRIWTGDSGSVWVLMADPNLKNILASATSVHFSLASTWPSDFDRGPPAQASLSEHEYKSRNTVRGIVTPVTLRKRNRVVTVRIVPSLASQTKRDFRNETLHSHELVTGDVILHRCDSRSGTTHIPTHADQAWCRRELCRAQ